MEKTSKRGPKDRAEVMDPPEYQRGTRRRYRVPLEDLPVHRNPFDEAGEHRAVFGVEVEYLGVDPDRGRNAAVVVLGPPVYVVEGILPWKAQHVSAHAHGQLVAEVCQRTQGLDLDRLRFYLPKQGCMRQRDVYFAQHSLLSMSEFRARLPTARATGDG